MQAFTLTRTISADGKIVEDQIEGIKGKGCGKVADVFATVGEEVESQKTPDYYKPAPVATGSETSTRLHVGGGKLW